MFRFRIVTLLAAAACAACIGQSPVSPESAEDLLPGLRLASAALGSYSLEFYRNGPGGFELVTSLPVSSAELILGARITDASGAPAQAGAVTFQYCSLKGGPPNDITRADEAPLQACADGTAKWANLGSVRVSATGYAYLGFGVVLIPRTVGFRCTFSGRGTPISSGKCQPKDFTWTP